MNLEKYPLVTDDEHLTYEFLSEGPKGTIKKVVLFQEVEDNVFNLAFGDWDEEKQKINDKTRSNNSDRDKVLATVASTVIDFIKYHPDASIFAQGSTRARTRLYQIAILSNLEEISKSFEIQGNSGGFWEPFEDKKNYQAILLEAK